MQIRISDHGRLFRNVFNLAISNNLEAAAMPGVDGGFRARKNVGLFLSKLGAKKLSAT